MPPGVAGSGLKPPAAAGWINFVPPLSRPLFGDTRVQLADIVSMGAQRFTIIWVEHDQVTYAAHFDLSRGTRSFGRRLGTGGTWVRASTSQPLHSRHLVACVSPVPVGIRFTNFAAHEGSDGAYLTRFTYCNGWRAPTTQFLGPGSRPSVAFANAEERGLVVWAKQRSLQIRTLTARGVLGPMQTLLTVDTVRADVILSTDIVFNEVSEQYIVGIVIKDPLRSCSVVNVRVGRDGQLIGAVRQHAVCDSDRGGHHTSVAICPQPRNPTGSYAWSHEDPSGSGARTVEILDAQGERIESIPPLLTPWGGTQPVGEYTADIGLLPVQYAAALYQPPRITRHAYVPTTWVPRPQIDEPAFPIAIRGIGSKAVVIYGALLGQQPDVTVDWRVSVLD